MRGMKACKLVVMGVVCVALASGCRSKPKGGPVTDTLGEGEMLGGGSDIGLTERGELGQRITDVQFDNVLFDYDKYEVRNAEISKVEQVAAYLRSQANVRLVCEGHCDERGSREYNMSLGEHRALAVRAYLVGLGIDGSRIQTKSYGKEMPLDTGHSPEAWQKNRRVEFALYK